MPIPIIGAIAASVGGSLISANAQRKAGAAASSAQVKAAQLGIDEQRRQFDQVRELLNPFVTGGTQAFTSQLDLVGASGPEAQQAAIDQLQQGPLFQTLAQQGEDAILANASATGGLRGGNTQAALAQFRPGLLNQVIQQQFGNLGGLAGVGQASAAGVGAAGQASANQITALLGQQGAAQAGNALAQGQATQNLVGSLGGLAGNIAGLGGFGGGLFKNAFGGGQGILGTPSVEF